MAFAIVQVVMARVGHTPMNTAMKLIRTSPSLALDVQELREHERPPIVTMPAYRARAAAGAVPVARGGAAPAAAQD